MLSYVLVNFILENHLENLEINTQFDGCLVWTIYLDDSHTKELEYTYYFDADEFYVVYYNWGGEENMDLMEETIITPADALELRGIDMA